MDHFKLVIISCMVLATHGWSVPFYPVHQVHGMQRLPHRFIRHVRHVHPPVPIPIRVPAPARDSVEQWQRPKRDHDYDHDHDHDRDYNRGHSGHSGVTGPVHTFVKTDKNANYKWGVRHHVGNKFAS